MMLAAHGWVASVGAGDSQASYVLNIMLRCHMDPL